MHKCHTYMRIRHTYMHTHHMYMHMHHTYMRKHQMIYIHVVVFACIQYADRRAEKELFVCIDIQVQREKRADINTQTCRVFIRNLFARLGYANVWLFLMSQTRAVVKSSVAISCM